MKRFLLAATLVSTFLYSCKTDFDVTSDWEDIAIVYGLLDPTDTAQYIKINKAFLDKSVSALVIAQNPDSLYYQNITVQLQQFQNSVLKKTIDLVKVDGNLEGFVKDTGIFANSPNFLYKTAELLDQNSSYHLLITESDNGKVISAVTEIINDFAVLRPTSSQKVNFFPGDNYNGQFVSAKDGKIYGLIVRFNYREVNSADPSIFTDKYIDWEIFTNKRSNTTAGGQTMDYDISGDGFYSFVNSQLQDDATIYRQALDFDFMFSVGGETLDTYNQVAIAQQGLTSGNIQPEYTNVENGLGLFSSRFYKTIFNVPIDDHTIDTLACSEVTRHLRFENTEGDFCF
ncbi:MAG TPA: hypothetical protein PLD84_03945 [Chitinophagales bacterium]|nr:hypothetical protein [Chitinophagales bacterium]